MIAITGSTGTLGRLVIEDLLDRGMAPSESDDLRRLIGRPTAPLEEAVAAALDPRD